MSAKKRKRNDETSTGLESYAESFLRSVWPEHVAKAKNAIRGILRDKMVSTQFLIDLMDLSQNVSVGEIHKKLFKPSYEVKGFADIDVRPWREVSGARGVMYTRMSSMLKRETPPEYVFDAKRFIDKQPTRTAFLLWPILFICKLADEEGLPGDVFGIDHQEIYTIMHDITGYNTLGSFDDVFDVPADQHLKFIENMLWKDMIETRDYLGRPPKGYEAFYKLKARIENKLKEMAKTFLDKPLKDLSYKEREILRDYDLMR